MQRILWSVLRKFFACFLIGCNFMKKWQVNRRLRTIFPSYGFHFKNIVSVPLGLYALDGTIARNNKKITMKSAHKFKNLYSFFSTADQFSLKSLSLPPIPCKQLIHWTKLLSHFCLLNYHDEPRFVWLWSSWCFWCYKQVRWSKRNSIYGVHELPYRFQVQTSI